MRDKLIQAFPIPWLEHIFVPTGMLLVAKELNPLLEATGEALEELRR